MSIQHGIKAVSNEGTRFKATGSLLTKDNYMAWSSKMNQLMIAHRVWDLVSGNRTLTKVTLRSPSPDRHLADTFREANFVFYIITDLTPRLDDKY